jgi:antitoxin (DNA-binding transcriptional repressor) of toxin-antitoxin stability system
MREIQASDAKTHLPPLLDDGERGETLIIYAHGRAIARIVPEADRRQAEVDKAVASILELRKRTGKLTLAQISCSTARSQLAGYSRMSKTRERNAAFRRIKTGEAVVPSFWWFEIRNILVVNERITKSDTGVFLRSLAGLRIRVDREPDEGVVLQLARTHRRRFTTPRTWSWRSGRRYGLEPWTISSQPRHVWRVRD